MGAKLINVWKEIVLAMITSSPKARTKSLLVQTLVQNRQDRERI